MNMVIKGAKTIAEFKQRQDEIIQNWIDANFMPGAVTWEHEGALNIRITDKTGDSMLIPLDNIN
jgi:hypothetical protein